MAHLRNLRSKLQTRKNDIMRATFRLFSHQVVLFMKFVNETPVLKAIDGALDGKFDGEQWVTQWEQHNIPMPSDEVQKAALCRFVLRKSAIDDDFAVTLGHELAAGAREFQVMVDAVKDTCFLPYYQFLDERLDDGGEMIYLLQKFKARCEAFDRRELYEAYTADTAHGEAYLDSTLRRFLFDQGVDYPFSTPRSASGTPSACQKREASLRSRAMASNHKQSLLQKAKSLGFSDWQIATLVGSTEDEVRALRKKIGLVPSYRLVDTCAAEFEAYTPYYYSTYDTGDDEIRKTDTRKVMILGGGPNRIGQGIEFDYCCVHAAFALKELGFETIMVNSNPETVSTDYDTSDKLFFEPLTQEDVLNIYEREQCWGAIAQFGGQTPLNLALGLQKHGVNIIGTSPQSIEIAEDRKLFSAMLDKLGIPQPPNGIATTEDEALAAAHKVGYPVLVRPSFVLGGRAMQIVYSDDEIRHYMRFAVEASPERPVLVDKFLEEAFEVDVDCVADIGVGGDTVVVGGMLEQIEFAGCHSGDAAMVLPPHSIWPENIERMRRYTHTMARELKVAGLMNVQFAVKGMNVWVLEVNPRASRTVPFVSKAIGVPLAKLAAKVMTGKKLTELGFTGEIWPKYYSVKESVFPFSKFPGQDILLGPEMRSTGEVMGIGEDWGVAYAKSQMAAAPALPQKGRIFISVRDSDKKIVLPLAHGFSELGFELCATSGTARVLQENGIKVQALFKLAEGRPNVLDMIKNGEVQLIVNTPAGKTPRVDEVRIRSAAVAQKIPIMTTLASANAALLGIQAFREKGLTVRPLQEYHAALRGA